MRTHAITFVAGAASFAALTYAAGFHASAWTFAAGAGAAVILAAAALSSPRRLRRASTFLSKLADLFDRRPQASTVKISERGSARAAMAETGTVADVVAALQGLGARRENAEAAARKAAEGNPAANFNQQFRTALAALKGAN